MVTGRKLAYRSLSVALAFQNALDDRNSDVRIKIGDDLSINLVRLLPVALELTVLNCVHQTLIGTRVSSYVARGQHGCVLPLLARGRHWYAGRAIR